VCCEQAPTYQTAQAAREELNSFFDHIPVRKHALKKDFTAAAAKQQLNAIFGNSKADHMDKKIHTIEQKTVSFVPAGSCAPSAHGSARMSGLGVRCRVQGEQLIFARVGTAARPSCAPQCTHMLRVFCSPPVCTPAHIPQVMQDLAYSTRDANSDLDDYFNNLQQSNVRANNRQKFLKSHGPRKFNCKKSIFY
jgi:hypothetical protein